ncbi:gliding motility lipoprotein GldD [Labilibacter sediminis]|nr:gliding motility lipoprotein GldD [Labilibacter sediminis]
MKIVRNAGRTFVLLLTLVVLIVLSSCNQHVTPKPRGYFRINFPEHEYDSLVSDNPYTFNVPVYVQVNQDFSPNTEAYWMNLDYPEYKGRIHLSYKKIEDNLNIVLEDSRKLAYKHSVKADAIGERLFLAPEKKVYGILYEIKGDAASSVQFYLTDSIQNFVRGSLYFNVVPNKDSLAPVVDFVTEDIIHLMETFEWKSLPKF